MFGFTKRKKQSILDYNATWWGRSNTWVCMFFLYLPLVILVLFSFNNSKRNIVWRGFTTKYWSKMWENTTIWDTMLNSLVIASVTMVFAVILGILAAYALERYSFRGRAVYDASITVPLIVPEICMAIALMVFFLKIDMPRDWIWPFNLTSLVLAHTAFCFPFATLIIRARLSNFDRSLEEAGKDMGASQWQILCHIVIPYLKPAIISAGLLSFIMSLDDFVVTFFVSTAETPTFPVYVYSLVRMGVTPAINAASTLLILLTIVILGLSIWYQKKSAIQITK